MSLVNFYFNVTYVDIQNNFCVFSNLLSNAFYFVRGINLKDHSIYRTPWTNIVGPNPSLSNELLKHQSIVTIYYHLLMCFYLFKHTIKNDLHK